MFWKNKKQVAEVEGLPVLLSRRVSMKRGVLSDYKVREFLAYKDSDEWRGLVGYEEYKAKVDDLDKKLNLILEHLKLEYVPESEKKEPAKLAEKKSPITVTTDWKPGYVITCIAGGGVEPEPEKPKRKYTKRKKK